MKLQFLWDEEKTRQLHKYQLIVFIIGPILVFLYTFLAPASIPYKPELTIMGALMLLTGLINLIFINRPNQGIRLFVLILVAQTIGPAYMALSGGFNSIVGFAPFAIFYVSIYQLGAGPGTLVAIYTIVVFFIMQLWMVIFMPQSASWANFLFYMGNFLAATYALRFIGQQLSIQFEAKRKLEQVDDLKNQFISLSSHYLRTPLTVINSYVTQMEKTTLDRNQSHYLKIIGISTSNLNRLIEKFLTITSIERGQAKISPTPSNLTEAVKSVVHSFNDLAQQKNITIQLQQENNIPEFSFDLLKFKEALANLVDNSIKFNKPGGTVTISSTALENHAVIKVIDNGQGIKKKHLGNLFSAFNHGSLEETLQTDLPGTGLSLYLTKLIIEAHGGEISVSSEEGQGSTFTITLPINMQR